MDKRALHHVWTKIRPIKTWYLFALCIACTIVCVFALRSNSTTMMALRSDVYAADKNNVDVVGALNKLRSFVNAHMNTSLERKNGVYPPIQLMYTYERLQKAEKDRVNVANSQVYTDAQNHCERLFPGSFSGGPRVPCIEQYVKEHVTTAKPIPQELYRFNFASPPWSPDLAGITKALAIFFLAMTILRFVAGRALERLTR